MDGVKNRIFDHVDTFGLEIHVHKALCKESKYSFLIVVSIKIRVDAFFESAFDLKKPAAVLIE